MKRVTAQHATRVVDVLIENAQQRLLLETLKGTPAQGSYHVNCVIDGNPLSRFDLRGLDRDGNLTGVFYSDRLDDEREGYHTSRVESYEVTIESGPVLGDDVTASQVRVTVHRHHTDEIDD